MRSDLLPSPPQTLTLHYKPLGEIIYVIKEIHGVPYFKMTSYDDLNLLHCTKDSIDSLKETSLVEYEHFEDSLNSTVDSLEVQNTFAKKRYNEPSSDKLTSVSEQSFSDLCDEFNVFLTDDGQVIEIENNPPTVGTTDKETTSNVLQIESHDKVKTVSNILSKHDYSDSHDVSYKVVGSNSDLFDIDKEMNDISTSKARENEFKFHDIESEFFETDNEGTDVERKYFQDVESDFFDDDDMTASGKSCSTPKKFSSDEKKVPQTPKPETRLNTRRTAEEMKKDKATVLSNSLLRSTINELEKALNDSNILLAKRDLKIQELRQQNNSLQEQLNKNEESCSQLKLLLLEKETIIADNESSILKLQNNVEKLKKENSELTLYKLNNVPNQDSLNVSADSSYHSSDENIHPHTPADTKSKCPRKKKQLENSSKINGVEIFNKTCPSERRETYNNTCKKKCIRKQTSAPVSSGTVDKTQKEVENVEDKISQNQNHAHLRMKFMRDAFFYYMIGFHPDEQINAILAILDYGDKRQDFVLEAHKLKKHGKKLNITKVSTRSLAEKIERKDSLL